MYTGLTTRLAALRHDTHGTTAVLFSICLLAFVMLLGCAVDIGRAVHTKARVATALDAAALAAAKSLHDKSMDTEQLVAIAQRYFDANIGTSSARALGQISDFTVNVDRSTSAVTVSATANVQTTFARVGGIDKISMPSTAAAAFDPKDIEVSLSLDVTGSMCSPCSKIADLQSAAHDLVDILLPANKSTSNKVRVALAPFAASVNAGTYADAATNRRSADGCVFERSGSDEGTDAAPAGGSYMKVAGDPGVVATRNVCPSGSKITALTDDASALGRAIDALRTSGSTAGHLGTAWAWYLVSPKWGGVWPASARPVEYGDKRTIKAVILMTDGVYNTFGGTCDRGCTNLSAEAQRSQAAARSLCSSMKDGDKVVVYTIGFKLDDAIAESVLRDCATSESKFHRAENREQLRTAFRTIAEDLMRLRLSK